MCFLLKNVTCRDAVLKKHIASGIFDANGTCFCKVKYAIE